MDLTFIAMFNFLLLEVARTLLPDYSENRLPFSLFSFESTRANAVSRQTTSIALLAFKTRNIVFDTLS